jgi:aryl-alcohol dehydrogenase-like predicted oxidoreductase
LPDDRTRVPFSRPIGPPRLRGGARRQQLRTPRHGDRDAGGTDAVVAAALEAGVNFIDTADIYGAEYGLSETLLGESLRGPSRRGRHRDEVRPRDPAVAPALLGARAARGATSAWPSKGRCGACQTDWIDLYQLHTPDPETPIDETIAALDELVRAGKVRYVGHSNLSGWQVAEAELVARELGATRFVSAQNEYNLLSRGAEAEVCPRSATSDSGSCRSSRCTTAS